MLCTIRNKGCVRQSLLLAHADVAPSGALGDVAGVDTRATPVESSPNRSGIL